MKILKFKKFFVCLNSIFFLTWFSFNKVEASIVFSPVCSRFENSKEGEKKVSFSDGEALLKDLEFYVYKLKETSLNEKQKIQVFEKYAKVINDFSASFKEKKIDFSCFSSSFVARLFASFDNFRILISDFLNSSKKNNLTNSAINTNLLKIKENIKKIKKDIASALISGLLPNRKFEPVAVDHCRRLVSLVDDVYDSFINIKKSVNQKCLSLTEVNDFSSFIQKIEKAVNFMAEMAEFDKNKISLLKKWPKEEIYFIHPILNCSLKIFEILDELCFSDENSGLYNLFNFKLSEVNSETIENLKNKFKNWCRFVGAVISIPGVRNVLRYDSMYLDKFKELFLELCGCDNITDFDSFIFKLNCAIDEVIVLFSKKTSKPFPSVYFNSVDWKSLNMIGLLDKLLSKTENFMLKNNIKRYDKHKKVIERLEKLITYLKAFETNSTKLSAQGYEKTYFNTKEKLDNFDFKYRSIFEKLCSINSQSYDDYCRGILNDDRIDFYLNRLVSEFKPLKQMISRTACFSDYVNCHKILNELKERFESEISDDFKNKNENYKELSDLTYLCKIFADKDRRVDTRLLNIIKELNLKLANVDQKNNEKELNFELLQNIDLIISLLEKFADDLMLYSDDYAILYECFSILLNKDSNIANFLNSFFPENKYMQFCQYFGKDYKYCYDKHLFCFLNLPGPDVLENVDDYAKYVIIKLKYVRTSFFHLLGMFEKNNRKSKAQLAVSKNPNSIKQVFLNKEHELIFKVLDLKNYIIDIGNNYLMNGEDIPKEKKISACMKKPASAENAATLSEAGPAWSTEGTEIGKNVEKAKNEVIEMVKDNNLIDERLRQYFLTVLNLFEI